MSERTAVGGAVSSQRLTGLLARVGALTSRAELRLIATCAVLAAVVLLALLLLPGRSFIAKYVHDMMVFVDASHRIADGQAPNRDFHTPLGPLAFLLPALGLRLGGSIGAMMPLATAAFAVIFIPLVVYAAWSRLPLGQALLFALFFLLLSVGPLNPGETPATVSFGMFYNRFGWALLSTLFLLALPRRAGNEWLDGYLIASALLLMFYLKVSYAMLGLPFAMALLAFPSSRKAALAGLVMAAAVGILIEALWGATDVYVSDISAAGRASGAVRGSLFGIGSAILQNLSGIFLYGAGLLFAILRGARRHYLLLSLYMVGAGILLFNQNSQVTGIMTLIPAVLVALNAPVRPQVPSVSFSPAPVAAVVAAALMVQPAGAAAAALVYHTLKASGVQGTGPHEAAIDGMVTQEARSERIGRGSEVLRLAYRSGSADLYTLNLARHAQYRQPLAQSEYLHSVKDAVTLLRGDPRLTGSVLVMDFSNPLNALLGRPPARGGDAWNHEGRTFSRTEHRPANEFFAAADVVMVPKAPAEWVTAQVLQDLYAPYLAIRYELVAESDYWQAYRRAHSR